MGTPPEIRLATIERTLANTAALLALAVEGVARTGAFDQAGNHENVVALLEAVRSNLADLGYANADALLRSARERVDNTIHIRRLFERG